MILIYFKKCRCSESWYVNFFLPLLNLYWQIFLDNNPLKDDLVNIELNTTPTKAYAQFTKFYAERGKNATSEVSTIFNWNKNSEK